MRAGHGIEASWPQVVRRLAAMEARVDRLIATLEEFLADADPDELDQFLDNMRAAYQDHPLSSSERER